MKNLYYYFVRLIAKMAVYLFYHPIAINGKDNIPTESSHLIFAPNHQSAFLDAILVAVFSTKPIHFLTRADIFTFPFKYFLHSLNMMPVYRLRDGVRNMNKNEAVFEACKNLVQSGKPILLFPEASQELVHYLRPLTKGLSRIALLSQTDLEKTVYIIPVGLNYFDHLNGNSKLIVNFGKAISVKEIIENSESEIEALSKIKDATSEELNKQMMIPENDDHHVRKLQFLNRNYYHLNFADFKNHTDSTSQPMTFAPSKINYAIKILSYIPNVVYKLIEALVLKLFVKDKTFYASIKVALLMFVFPLQCFFSFFFLFQNFGIGISTAVVMMQFLTIRFSH